MLKSLTIIKHDCCRHWKVSYLKLALTISIVELRFQNKRKGEIDISLSPDNCNQPASRAGFLDTDLPLLDNKYQGVCVCVCWGRGQFESAREGHKCAG